MENEVDVELEMAHAALAAAQKRKAQAEENARLVAAAALAKRLADEEERLAKLKAEAEENDRRHAERKTAEAEAIRQADAQRAADTRRLEQELEKHNEEIRQEEARKERVRKITEAAHQAEVDAQNLEFSLKQAQIVREEPKPATLETNPLGRILGRSAPEVVTIRDLSSEENAKLQAEKDRAANAVQQSPRKSRAEVDWSASQDVIKVVKDGLHFNLNLQRADQWSSIWNYGPLLTAVRAAIEQAKVHPVGHDQFCSLVDAILENPAPKPLYTPEELNYLEKVRYRAEDYATPIAAPSSENDAVLVSVAQAAEQSAKEKAEEAAQVPTTAQPGATVGGGM